MISPLSFNVINEKGQFLCPVCGFSEFSSSPAYSEKGGEIGITLCPCCLWEPVFDDCPSASAKAKSTILTSILAYRDDWAATKHWQGRFTNLPENYDGTRQLEELLRLAPDIQ